MAVQTKRLLQFGMAVHTLIYRLSSGRLLNVGNHIVLLTTMGRKSGQLRTAPLYSVRDGDAYIIVGSYGGNATHPAWYHNLQAYPHALVTDRGHTRQVTVEIVEGTAYERLWDLLTEHNPAYLQYRERTTRVLPIVCLRPA